MMAAQFNAFLDSTKELCKTQQLSGKPVAIITGTNSQGGGQETTVLTGITPLVHHGMIFVPFGIRFTYSHEFGNVKEVKGGSPYGTGTYVGRGANRLRVDACIRPWLLLWQHHKAAQGSYCIMLKGCTY
ncbi:Flavoprotein-like protein YCP4 [Glycine soja]|uniref:Flavoprotein-like protein YCP4 n=1 Tax=Glycine soja TaxID=3848 RepID=A0A0B2R3A3_GLYSO|nr:Flavoprotein-like protein YCP4 [Glycine soja]